MNAKYFFSFVVPPVRLLPFTYPHPRLPFHPFFPFPLSFTFFPPEPPPPSPKENVTASDILSNAVSHLHEGKGKLRKTCADTVGHFTESIPSLQSLTKWPPAQRFDMQAADWPSRIQVLIQCQAAWHGWLPRAGDLSHTECSRSWMLSIKFGQDRWKRLKIYSTNELLFRIPMD